MSEDRGGVWIAYHTDWSGFRAFRTEVEALRHAVDFSMRVMLLPWDEDPPAVLKAQAERRKDERNIQTQMEQQMRRVAGLERP